MMAALQKLRFSTIFWKIFLSYWLVMIIIVSASFTAVALFADRDRFRLEREFIAQAKANALITVYEHGGAREARDWLHHRYDGRARHIYLIDEVGRDLLGKSVPDGLRQELAQGGTEYVEDDRACGIQTVTASSGVTYRVVGLEPPKYWRGELRNHRMPPLLPFRSVSWLLALLVTGVISFLLARHLTTPVRQLQAAAQQMAEGDLSTRVPEAVGKRRDELGELACDFNLMAGEIERLVTTQKRMLRDISHELRSPLARLQVALGLARKAAGESCDKDHDRIELEIERLNELIGQVISLVRLETSAQELKRSSVKLGDMLADVVEDARFEATSQHKQVELEVLDDLDVEVDAELLYSAIENIVRNAVAYTKTNSKVRVQEHCEAGQVIVSVRDQGPGVAENALGSLFDPFYREADARDRSSGGYGLGLAIAQRAVRLHGGDIRARNHPEGGLEMVIRLPDEPAAL